MVAGNKRMEPRAMNRDVSKNKLLEYRKMKVVRLLDLNGLGVSRAYMLDTQ